MERSEDRIGGNKRDGREYGHEEEGMRLWVLMSSEELFCVRPRPLCLGRDRDILQDKTRVESLPLSIPSLFSLCLPSFPSTRSSPSSVPFPFYYSSSELFKETKRSDDKGSLVGTFPANSCVLPGLWIFFLSFLIGMIRKLCREVHFT